MTVNFVKEHIHALPQPVLQKAAAIYVYGSTARGDRDGDSDCDILVCVDPCSEEELSALKRSVYEWEVKYNWEFAFYQMDTLRRMQEKGSYFLWHIRQEGVAVYQRSPAFCQLLTELPPYTGTHEDFLEYREILEDIRASAALDSVTREYDLSVLAVLARNICIGCCYLLGDMDFGRKTPVVKCIHYWRGGFPFSLLEYNELYNFRLSAVRGKRMDPQAASAEYMQCWLEKIEKTLTLAQSLVR